VLRERCAAGRSAFPPLGRRGDQLHAGERRGHRFLVHWAHRRARGASGGRHVGWDAASPSRPDRCGRAGALSGFAGRARLDAERSGGRQEPTPPARGAWMRTRRKDSVSWRRLVAPVTVRLLPDRLSVGPRPARDRCQRSRTGEAAGRRLGTGPPRPSAPRRTTARERRLVDSCPANRRRTATEQHARHECVFRSGCCPSGAGLAGRAMIRPHLRTQHEGSESGQAGSRRRHNASGRDGRSSRRVNRRDGDWLTGRRARAARSGAVGTLDGRTASGRAGRGGTVPEAQSTPCAGRARRSAPAAEGTRGDLALCLALCQESGGITRTSRRTGREKLSASGAPTGSSQLSRFPARAALAGSVEARGRTARLDRDRYRSFSVGRNQPPPRDRPVGGAIVAAEAGRERAWRRDRTVGWRSQSEWRQRRSHSSGRSSALGGGFGRS
jgi:hypothetical protein